MSRLAFADRSADKVEAVDKARRVVVLRASWETQEKLREWCKAQGFDLAWSYSGWPQLSWDFDFHVTIVASSNEVKIPDGFRSIDALTLTPIGYDVLGVDRRVPAFTIEKNKTLDAIRAFFVETYGVKPTFDEFKPHVSLSYKWDGDPPVEASAPALPDFPLVFDAMMVAQLDAPEKTKDAAPVNRRVLSASDRMPIAGTRKTADGYLVVEARVARGDNIQDYYGYEIGASDPQKVYKVYRPADEVFKADTLKSFAHRPVTMGHPQEGVTADNWRQTAIGSTGSEVIRDGEFVRVSLAVMDAGAIDDIEKGVREISMGYDCELVMNAGTTADGRAYDAFQKNHRMNHVAIVEVGRAGPQCRIGDQSRNKPQQEHRSMKTVTIDGKAFDVTDEAAVAIAKLQADAQNATKTAKDAAPVLDQALAVISEFKIKDEAATKAVADAKAEADAAKAKIPTADALHAMAAELSSVADAAKTIAPDLDVKGKTVDAIKLAAVTHVVGDEAVKGKTAEYIAATFDHLVASNDDDPVAKAIASRTGTSDAAITARQKYLDSQSNAWKQ